ncbi:MAG: hypothetical protein SFU91_07810 [Chloroherpetonaceae bacterium]|nr:hypothetical protein [Chloroherpetonaceae bacterium]
MPKVVRKKSASKSKTTRAEFDKKLQKKIMREAFIAQGGYDGRYKTKVVTDKRKSTSRTLVKATIKKILPEA